MCIRILVCCEDVYSTGDVMNSLLFIGRVHSTIRNADRIVVMERGQVVEVFEPHLSFLFSTSQ